MKTTKRQSVMVTSASFVLVILFGLALVGQQRSTGSPPTIKGVWRNTQIAFTGPNARTIAAQPGLFIFTDKHFSVVRVNNDTARPALPPLEKATDKEVATALRAFTAFAGTYEVAGDELRTNSTVELIPNNIRSAGFSRTFTYKIDGKTLQLVQKATSDGPITNPGTFRYERVE